MTIKGKSAILLKVRGNTERRVLPVQLKDRGGQLTSWLSSSWCFVSLLFLAALSLYSFYFSPYSLHRQEKLQEEIVALTKKVEEKKQTLAAVKEKKLVSQTMALAKQDYVRANELLVDLKLPELEKKEGEKSGYAIMENKETKGGFLSFVLKKPFFLSAFFFLGGLLFFLRRYR